jgi:hypothetical protein
VPRGRLTRQQLLTLGQAQRPWDFVPLAIQALAQQPKDDDLRYLLAVAYARLGLATPAAEQLQRIDPIKAAADPAVQSLRASLVSLPPDRVAVTERAKTLNTNLHALRPGERDALAPLLGRWMELTIHQEWFRLRDGQIVRRPLAEDQGEPPAWLAWRDELLIARTIPLPRADGTIPPSTPAPAGPSTPTSPSGATGPGRPATPAATTGARPIYLEGIDPPWLLLRLARELPRAADGSWAPVTIIHEQPLEALDALACIDLAEILSQDRFRLVVGPGADRRLLEWLDQRHDTMIGGFSLRWPGLRTPMAAPLEQVISTAGERQVRALESHKSAAARAYASRDRAWWAKRYRAALSGEQPPLKVLIPTTRFSTFIKHSSQDLADALGALGVEARVLIEPDDASPLSSVALTGAVARFEPDLIVQINYTRSAASGLIPGRVPFVCWIQDGLSHLFDARVGAAQGSLDFVVGHLHAELFEQFKWPRARALATPVLVSETKFHPGAVDSEREARLRCEVACVTHHSQTPEQFRDQWRSAAGAGALGPRVIDTLYPAVLRIAQCPMEGPCAARLIEACAAALKAAGADHSPPSVTLLLNQFARPLADRALRHQSLHWAAEIAQERGWRLHLYGQGWDRHPTLGRFARGALAHGEDLRAAYQLAAAQLHVSINLNTHQRVMECALAGGLPLARLKADDVEELTTWTLARQAADAQPFCCNVQHRAALSNISDGPDTLRWAAQMQRLGRPVLDWVGVSLHDLANPWHYWGGTPIPREQAWLLGDLCETTFCSREELEARLDRAVNNPGWRADVVSGIAGRVRGRLSYRAFAATMLEWIAGHLRDEPNGARA